MERKNTVLLTVIAVATLLVAVVGATFAYFTASNTATGEGSKAEVQTEILEGTTFTFNGANEANNYLTYPGGLAVFGAKADFKKSGSGLDTNDYDLKFDLEIDYTNETSTDLFWALYMIEGSGISKDENPLESKLDPACKLVVQTEQGEQKNETHYWYSDKNDTPAEEVGKSCTLNQDQLDILADTHMIAYGKLSKTTSSAKITASDVATAGAEEKAPEHTSQVTEPLYNAEKNDQTNPLKDRELDTKNNPVKYYYLVVQYPNETAPQNSDQEQKNISVTLKVADKSAKAEIQKTA